MTVAAAVAAVLALLSLGACVWRLMDTYPDAHRSHPEVRPATLVALPLATACILLLALT